MGRSEDARDILASGTGASPPGGFASSKLKNGVRPVFVEMDADARSRGVPGGHENPVAVPVIMVDSDAPVRRPLARGPAWTCAAGPPGCAVAADDSMSRNVVGEGTMPSWEKPGLSVDHGRLEVPSGMAVGADAGAAEEPLDEAS